MVALASDQACGSAQRVSMLCSSIRLERRCTRGRWCRASSGGSWTCSEGRCIFPTISGMPLDSAAHHCRLFDRLVQPPIEHLP